MEPNISYVVYTQAAMQDLKLAKSICAIKFASFYRNIQISFLFLYSVKLVSKPHKNQALDCDTSTQNSIVERKNDPRVPQADFWDFEGGDGG